MPGRITDRILSTARDRQRSDSGSSILTQLIGAVGIALYGFWAGLEKLWSILTSLLGLPFRLSGWTARQIKGTQRNAERGWAYLTLDRMLPPSIVGLIQWFIETVPNALGLRNAKPWQQVGAAITLTAVAILTTVLSGGLLIAVLVVVVILLLIGLVRFIPFINKQWENTTEKLPIENDYNVPRWSRD